VKITRRTILAGALAGCATLRADSADDAFDVVASAARALTEATALAPPNRGGPQIFLSYFDSKMPGFATLRANVTALIAQDDLSCSLDPVANEGDDKRRELEVDWILRLVATSTGIDARERHEKVKVRVEKQGRKWRITSFEPLSFFAV
jgi:hypothetical protein